MHSQHISPLCPQTPGLSLWFCLQKQAFKTLAKKKDLVTDGRRQQCLPSSTRSNCCFHLSFKLLWTGSVPEKATSRWLLMSQVRAIAYLCCLLWFYVDKLQVHSRCHWTQGSAEARYFHEWPIGTVICGSGFKRFYLSENPIEQMESCISVHNVVNIYFLFFHKVVNIYNKKFIWCSQVCCDCIWRQWGLFPKGIYLVLKKMWLCFLV